MPVQNPAEPPPPVFPAVLPEIRITELDEPPFVVDCRELRCWSIVPVAGEAAIVADYGLPGWSLSEVTALRALGATEVRGVEGVEIEVRQWKPESGWHPRAGTIIARLTAHKVEFLAVHLPQVTDESATQFETFLDENFAGNWGAVDRALADAGSVQRDADSALTIAEDTMPDSIGAGLVRLAIGGLTFRCLRVLNFLDVDSLRRGEGYFTESYVTEAGRTVLVRRYCPSRFAEVARFPVVLDPDDTRTINGIVCLHWYDTLTDVALSDD